MTKIGFIGAGRMAEAIIQGLVENEYKEKTELISFYCRTPSRQKGLSETYGIKAECSNSAVYCHSDVVFLAVKPQQLTAVINDLADTKALSQTPLVVSIMAGTPLSLLIQLLDNTRIVRVMPNVAAQVKKSMSALASAKGVDETDLALVECLFETIGRVSRLSEEQLEAASAVNGCGPAFFFQLIEAGADALVSFGIPRDMAYDITAQTMVGAGELVLQSHVHPAELKDAVTSPGGTTIAGCLALEAHAVRAGLAAAIEASYNKTFALREKMSDKNDHEY